MGIATILVAATLAACSGGGVPMTSEPDPEPLPTLEGSWRRTDTYVSAAGDTWRYEFYLTFTGDRAIRATMSFNETTGRVVRWVNNRGAELADTTTTVRWFEDLTEDEQDNPVHGSVEKAYHWGNAERSVVFLHQWSSLFPVNSFERWERVPADTLASPVGSWQFESSNSSVIDLTIAPDGTFVLTDNRADGVVWQLSGTATPDLANYAVNLSNLVVTQWNAQGTVEIGPEPWEDQEGRAAFVPFHRGIAVSPPWDERDPDVSPYGNYWMFFERATE